MPVYVVDPRPMTHDEIVAAVRRIRYSSKRLRNSRKAPSVNALAQAAGINRLTAYRVADNARMAPETADKLRSVLSSDSNGT